MTETNLESAVQDPDICAGTAFGCRRDFLNNRFVYAVVSSRAGGLSVGINLNPDKLCNFDCVYCEVNRSGAKRESSIDIQEMTAELERTLALVHSGRICERPDYRALPPDLLKLRHVALSGDGEPTLCPEFAAVVDGIIHVRARAKSPLFKLVLITNASGLDRPEVEEGLRHFMVKDEVWAKLDAGTQEGMNRVNCPDCSLEQILSNILRLACRRPVIIQSLFPAIHGDPPPAHEIESYVQRLKELKDAGAQIPLVQVYSATRPSAHPESGHLSLRSLVAIAQRVREVTGLKAEVF